MGVGYGISIAVALISSLNVFSGYLIELEGEYKFGIIYGMSWHFYDK